MEPEGSLPQSQVPANCPYPEPARSSTYPHIQLPKDSSLYYPPIYTWTSQVVSFQVSPLNPCTGPSHPPYALHAPPISFFSILSPEQYWVWSTDSPHYYYLEFSTRIDTHIPGCYRTCCRSKDMILCPGNLFEP